MGLGLRQVADLMAEIGLHLVEPLFNQTLSAPVGPGAALSLSLTPPSNPSYPLPATSYLYPGALVVVGWHAADAEQVSVIAVTGPTTFTANLLNAHLAGEQVFGATFPTQQPTDPIFTQQEIIGYIAQAQNEFLTKVPLIFAFLPNQELIIGQAYQTLPNNLAIELERVAIQSNPQSLSFNISTISRLAGVVTAVLASSTNPDQWTPGLAIQVYAVTDDSYNIDSLPTPNATFPLATVSQDGLTLTWLQAGPDSSSSGGYVSRPILTRLYESSQEQISLNQPWQTGLPGITTPQAWFEDRQGIYGYGVSPPPQSNYFVELLASVRGPEALGLLDYFMVPDIFVYAIKWRALAYCWSKAGVQRSPTMERFAKGKFDFYCLLADRFLRNAIMKVGQAGAMTGGNF